MRNNAFVLQFSADGDAVRVRRPVRLVKLRAVKSAFRFAEDLAKVHAVALMFYVSCHAALDQGSYSFNWVNLPASRTFTRTTRISWSVNTACVCDNSYLGIWQVTQLLAATLHTVLAAAGFFDPARTMWQAKHLES